ncbi:MAG: hypothetical protein QOF90_675 [Acetobacteraceae bacterium]|nr:hypothetical protein [Acetobacteraceae bacterium]
MAFYGTDFHPVLQAIAADLSWAGYRGRQNPFLHAARVSLHDMRIRPGHRRWVGYSIGRRTRPAAHVGRRVPNPFETAPAIRGNGCRIDRNG